MLSLILHKPRFAIVVQIEFFHFLFIQWPGTFPAKHCDLAAGLIHTPVAIQAAGQA
jgi:hypothetical protein